MVSVNRHTTRRSDVIDLAKVQDLSSLVPPDATYGKGDSRWLLLHEGRMTTR
jgi:hypothetical protein